MKIFHKLKKNSVKNQINPPNKNYQANSHLMIGIKDQIYKIN